MVPSKNSTTETVPSKSFVDASIVTSLPSANEALSDGEVILTVGLEFALACTSTKTSLFAVYVPSLTVKLHL